MRERRLAVAGSFALAGASLLEPSVPTTDPWGWINWGREAARLRLDTVAGPPSWKPLPVLFTAPLSLLGTAAPDAWLLIARAAGLFALYLAYRVATLLAGRAAGVIAAFALALSAGWLRGLAHGYSEGLAVACLLGAVECHLAGRRYAALTLGVLVSLSRPEAWPLAALYGLTQIGPRPAVFALLASSPLLWALPDWWGDGSPLHAGIVAQVNLTRAGAHPGLTLLRSGAALLLVPVWALALAGATRERALGLIAAAWIALECIATELGYPGAARFLVLPAALVCVLAGVGAVTLTRRRAVPAVALAAACLPFALTAIVALPRSAQQSVVRARFQLDLDRVIAESGGVQALRGGARPIIPSRLWWNAGSVAWDLQVPLERVRKIPENDLADLQGLRPPAVLYVPLAGTPPDDPNWIPTHDVARRGLTIRTLASAGEWRALAITRNPSVALRYAS